MLHLLKPIKNARKTVKRLGRGPGSGNGKTSGKGHKGQLARAGGGTRLGFEGGQTPFFQRIPKRGFYNFNKKKYHLINLKELEFFENGSLITKEVLLQNKIIKKNTSLFKILSKGSFSKKIIVQANKFSNKAKAVIEKNGGSIEIIR
ncbi:MAG: 50S ribosomal protein L15 [Candidatus Phytoplasma stylosanthis]|nr:50S ribosomal protein L15 [Candidatus Phytoplasma stylosanthis]MDV3167857.1 50S ribosomal protein L15 [Candidatus Phytoplasma stylosanthis]MDV3170867.1 50S ribosomal protein L15 [Candidatus Phytoplasma stylosanthis]MDV3173507.1 50S ribosomal protein L15 [Candidatus Phytoplasma stylosanthis]MDV3174047.1 50S ribosomal protein L15 [Candidatus Phytoplasma stylosanthis]MDV3202441.1 50S ribosomal protein L15 [Candidatus Phytoplasma stylosanthis]